MSALRVSLFGQFRVQCDEQDITSLYARRLQELFCYLLLNRHRAHPRESLAALLWADSSTTQSKRNLRQALWQLQAALGSQGESNGRRILLTDAETICVSPAADLWLDASVFEQACARTEGVPGQALDSLQADALGEAVHLYRGDLLEGWFQDWCLYERERFQNLYLSILDKLMDHCRTTGEYECGLEYGARSLRTDQARERTHRRLMQLHYLTGNRTAALRQYDRCVQALRRELAVKPAKRTTMLYEQIRRELPIEPVPLPLPPRIGLLSPSRMPDVHRALRQVQATLAQLQEQLDRAICIVEQGAPHDP